MVLPLELITMVIIILRVEGKRYIVSQYLCNRLFHTSLISNAIANDNYLL